MSARADETDRKTAGQGPTTVEAFVQLGTISKPSRGPGLTHAGIDIDKLPVQLDAMAAGLEANELLQRIAQDGPCRLTQSKEMLAEPQHLLFRFKSPGTRPDLDVEDIQPRRPPKVLERSIDALMACTRVFIDKDIKKVCQASTKLNIREMNQCAWPGMRMKVIEQSRQIGDVMRSRQADDPIRPASFNGPAPTRVHDEGALAETGRELQVDDVKMMIRQRILQEVLQVSPSRGGINQALTGTDWMPAEKLTELKISGSGRRSHSRVIKATTFSKDVSVFGSALRSFQIHSMPDDGSK
jgi:hypothetical protein